MYDASYISYLLVIMYRNMQKLNRTALKQMLFFGIEQVYGRSVHTLLFLHGIGIGILAVELVCNWNWCNVIYPRSVASRS